MHLLLEKTGNWLMEMRRDMVSLVSKALITVYQIKEWYGIYLMKLVIDL